MSVSEKVAIPKAFIWRRLHSLLGLMVIIYLIEHLTVNSQAALWINDDGHGFVRLVNLIHGLPYLQVLEIALIGIPILFHGALGIKYALTGKGNSFPNKKSTPSLFYGRNVAYSWQRLTSWFLIIGILGHVVQMRFMESPKKTVLNNEFKYTVRLDFDEGLYSLSDRLGVGLFNKNDINFLCNSAVNMKEINRWTPSQPIPYNADIESEIAEYQSKYQEKIFVETLSSYRLTNTQVVAASDTIGMAFLLMVRNVFKSPLWAILYSAFVLAAVFHGVNGLWTALITWGVILSYRSQKMMVNFAILLMLILGFLGLASIWGTYFVNLRS